MGIQPGERNYGEYLNLQNQSTMQVRRSMRSFERQILAQDFAEKIWLANVVLRERGR
jgi:hypothetical protein